MVAPRLWLGVFVGAAFSVTLPCFLCRAFPGCNRWYCRTPPFVPGLAQVIRMARADAVDVLYEKMVVTAYAKGLTNRRVLIGHVLRNAMIPTTVMFFLSLPWVIGGSVVVEKIFAWPGMGQLLWQSIAKQTIRWAVHRDDHRAAHGGVEHAGGLLTGWLDPRIRNELRDRP